ncbi:pentapeptide repeat-containing protein [Mangrovihabitans endophyticus]|uniref:DinB-like domain-containing protein n=1 Tax=Mangrovihabitans endophyticus TaxID=1751298 RepID=A0A8J3C4F4_9ACTN|nr:pentapeptide repeat-containing protein [Mangrovihabitans endophyticus]GGL08124.1 hypothetical protein GCM10012284_48220 [Mangrovihabitans endophyticus]
MADFVDDDLTGSVFRRVTMTGASFDDVDLSGARLRAVDLSGAQLRGVDLQHVVMRGVELGNVDITGELLNVTINGDPAPWHPLDLPWDEMPDTPGVPRDRVVRPSLDEVLTLRQDRMSSVRELVDGLTERALDGGTEPVAGPGWPRPRRYPMREVLLTVLNEEWEHRLYAERDLDALAARHDPA